jgi:hypothetical protein
VFGLNKALCCAGGVHVDRPRVQSLVDAGKTILRFRNAFDDSVTSVSFLALEFCRGRRKGYGTQKTWLEHRRPKF